jgi:hypothetical protein
MSLLLHLPHGEQVGPLLKDSNLRSQTTGVTASDCNQGVPFRHTAAGAAIRHNVRCGEPSPACGSTELGSSVMGILSSPVSTTVQHGAQRNLFGPVFRKIENFAK